MRGPAIRTRGRRAPPLPSGAPVDADDADVAPTSRTQAKRDAEQLQALGAKLAALPPARLAAIDMPDALRDAITALHATRSHEGRRRQLQFVGKQMRAVDAAPLREAVAAYELHGAVEALTLHEAERWRTALIDGDEAVTRWMHAHPDTDVTALRRLVRAARAEGALPPDRRQGKAFRALFRLLQPALAQAQQTAVSRVSDVAVDDGASRRPRDDRSPATEVQPDDDDPDA